MCPDGMKICRAKKRKKDLYYSACVCNPFPHRIDQNNRWSFCGTCLFNLTYGEMLPFCAEAVTQFFLTLFCTLLTTQK